MRVKMSYQLSGTRDGKPWPGPGDEMDLPDDEARNLCAAKLATPVASEEKDHTEFRNQRKPKG